MAKRFADVDEWQTEMQLKPMRVGRVQLYTTGLDAEERRITGVEIVDSVEGALAAAIARAGDPRGRGHSRRTLCRPGRRLTRARCRRRRRSRSTSISSAGSPATCSSPRWSTRCPRSPRRCSRSSRPSGPHGSALPEFGETTNAGLRARAFGLASAPFAGATHGPDAHAHDDAGSSYPQLRDALVAAPLSAATRRHALAMLTLLAEAEARSTACRSTTSISTRSPTGIR